ncbi:3-methyladenine DNA glycosylase AlkD [Actinoalloteichus hoggarensis]|uniref:DNA alkylation repair enzyme n=1 Tax=Actinoalloteichus hoggarensis TaxID=1470176 RepID=A0A221W4W0_9PSEU|nr:DNA alkylation repair protein [Actinoalloteichus hoggarensis]ASO20753.1 DNA alkylation repair enzyme [Actinoalloteichus hoggarensis]MBB5920683.1 3-methyladenine DNA glycosylase AlkD [Actinoalloteichus hoggarensis]
MTTELTARRFVERLESHRSEEELRKIQRYFKTGAGEYGENDRFLGVRMGQVFALAKEFVDLPLTEIELLLASPLHEVRAGALSIMDKQARRRSTTPRRRQELYDLYLTRIDRIDNWDLVDVCAPHVIGGYLFDRPRDVLYRLARSTSLWERRTAIVSTAYFLRHGQVDDTFALAEILLGDEEDLIHKATGGWLREAGRRAPERLREFLDAHAATMPRTMLRYAIEHLEPEVRAHYRGLKTTARP